MLLESSHQILQNFLRINSNCTFFIEQFYIFFCFIFLNQNLIMTMTSSIFLLQKNPSLMIRLTNRLLASQLGPYSTTRTIVSYEQCDFRSKSAFHHQFVFVALNCPIFIFLNYFQNDHTHKPPQNLSQIQITSKQ